LCLNNILGLTFWTSFVNKSSNFVIGLALKYKSRRPTLFSTILYTRIFSIITVEYIYFWETCIDWKIFWKVKMLIKMKINEFTHELHLCSTGAQHNKNWHKIVKFFTRNKRCDSLGRQLTTTSPSITQTVNTMKCKPIYIYFTGISMTVNKTLVSQIWSKNVW